MSKTLRTLAAAAVMAVGLPQMASAALVTRTLDFELPGSGALSANAYKDAAHGNTVFSGSNAFFGTLAVPGGHNGGPTNVLYNGCTAACAGSLIEFTVNDLFQGTFDFWLLQTSSVGQITVAASTAGGQSVSQTLDLVNGWQHLSLSLAPNTKYSTVQIEISPFIAYIDDISFQTDDGRTSNVPEPASMALVALGLAGAAAAMRRRKA